MTKPSAPRNQTLRLEKHQQENLLKAALKLNGKAESIDIAGKIINQDIFTASKFLPEKFIDLLIIDPPYNLNKKFGQEDFRKQSNSNYQAYIHSWLKPLIGCLKPTASIYFCCDWQCSHPVQNLLQEYFIIRNRISWEREKGRGAKKNWKNNSEDIWFCTMGEDYYFDVDAVKLKKRVLTPYRDDTGRPKDWQENADGKTRLTHPSNLWTDISIPFWSMRENTDHPTQKSEKLMAKLILASSAEGDFIFDPFLGSGTSAVVAQKLNRQFSGIEIDPQYCALTLERLARARANSKIQGYDDGVFWERNRGLK